MDQTTTGGDADMNFKKPSRSHRLLLYPRFILIRISMAKRSDVKIQLNTERISH